jgi:hypothetical protein
MLPSEQAMAEICTFMGHTTKLLAINLPEAIIHSVDLPLDFAPDHDNVTEKKKGVLT